MALKGIAQIIGKRLIHLVGKKRVLGRWVNADHTILVVGLQEEHLGWEICTDHTASLLGVFNHEQKNTQRRKKT
jgi:hypothetical protein